MPCTSDWFTWKITEFLGIVLCGKNFKGEFFMDSTTRQKIGKIKTVSSLKYVH